MQLDWELIRSILIALSQQADETPLPLDIFEGASLPCVKYHIKLLYQGGLVEVQAYGDLDSGTYYRPTCMTLQGQVFLSYLKDRPVWNKIKQAILKRGLVLTFDIVKAVAVSVLTS